MSDALAELQPVDGASRKQLVGDVAYLGDSRQGRRVNEVAHEPLVTRPEWEAAQRSVGAAVPRGDRLLLTGLVVCASCSYRMKGSTSRGSCCCHGRHASGDCPRPTAITASALEEHVLDTSGCGMMGAELAVEQVDDTPFVSALEEAERELRAYVESVDASVLGPELYRRRGAAPEEGGGRQGRTHRTLPGRARAPVRPRGRVARSRSQGEAPCSPEGDRRRCRPTGLRS
jgi:hypothetical protein